jgi:hypothetical protein
MSSTINATTVGVGGIVTTADNSGILILQTASTTALTIDASQNVTLAKGITVGATAAPAFSAHNASSQSISSSTFTKITLGTEVFDTNSNFASSRFTPTVAGYYQINGILRATGTTMTTAVVAIYKNGSVYAYQQTLDGITASSAQLVANEVISMNGTTDYLELYGFITATSPSFDFVLTTINCRFNGAMVRSA